MALGSGSDNMRDDDSGYDSSISESVSEKSSSKNPIEQKKLDDAYSKMSKKNSSDEPKIAAMPVEKGEVSESDDGYEKDSNLGQPQNKSDSQVARKLSDAYNIRC